MLKEASLLLLGVSIYKAIKFISHSLNGDQHVAVVVDDSSNDEAILSQTVSPPAIKYDVFLSFRGEDTRHTFTSYLYKELRNAGIHTFMDHELCKGEQISQVILRRIEESEISIIIFSKNYASSTWCMDELVHILGCKKKFGRVVIPIFYNVEPSNIRKQDGSFGNGFSILKRRFKYNKEKLQKWRNALVQSTSLSGWNSNSTRTEFKFVEDIVKDILSKVNYKSSSHLERLVGISRHIENIEKLLNEASIMGIWGMGGAGKTTLAKALFQELKTQFDAFSFVEEVTVQLERVSLDELQKNCLKELLKDEDISIYDIKSNSVKSRLQRKKILLILDDVDNSIIVENLTNLCDWFGDGSRVIITSRNEQVLKNVSAFSTYHISELDFDDAFYLFSLKAFKQHEPYKHYMELSKSVVKYCQGNPLALVVLGCFLYRREKEEWESALEKLNESPPKDIVNLLKLSFDGLDEKQQNVFLDLAFLMKEGVLISVDLIRQLYGSSGYIEMHILREKSLISFNNHIERIEMHNLVKKMGLEIARQQLSCSPRTPVRLWSHEDIDYFFSCDKEIELIRCLSLDLSKITRITWRGSNFRKMHNLIYLNVYKSYKRTPSELTICGDLDYLPADLRFFSWEEYLLPNVPLQFCANNLIELNMPGSNVQQLWNRNQHFPNLKRIDLQGSKHLITFPDLSCAPKISVLDLSDCENLAQIHSSKGMTKLGLLSVEHGGPRRINIGGGMKGTRPELALVNNYLDLHKLSLNKVKMKVWVSGDIICGVGCTHVETPLGGIAELRYFLPFVKRVEWLEDPIEHGHDFKQHYDYDCDYDYCSRYYCPDGVEVRIKVRRRGDKGGERHVVGQFTRQMINYNHQISMEAAEEKEDEDDDEEEHFCGCSINYNATTFTRVPSSITRWSLLRRLTLRKSDMVEDSLILKSLSFSHASSKHLLDVTLSLDPNNYYFTVRLDSFCWLDGSIERSYHSDFDAFVLRYLHW